MTPAPDSPALSQAPAPKAFCPAGSMATAEPFADVTEVEPPRNRTETALQDAFPRIAGPAISDEEAERREREQAEAEAREEHTARLARFEELCPPAYRHPELVEAMRQNVPARVLRAALEWRPCGLKSGLLLHGETGGFKTTILYQIARRVIVEEGGRRVVLMRGDTLARDAAAAYGDPAKTAAWAERFRRARWLLIDELFKGSVTPSAMSALFDIIEHRTANLLPTVATSNATSERIAASARDPAAQESVDPILRRIRGGHGGPGYFDCLHVPAPGAAREARA